MTKSLPGKLKRI